VTKKEVDQGVSAIDKALNIADHEIL